MALMQIAFNGIGVPSAELPAPYMIAAGASCENLTPSGTSQQSTVASSSAAISGARVATDTAIYVSFGSDPNASTDDERFYLPAGTVEYFLVQPSSKAAVVTA